MLKSNVILRVCMHIVLYILSICKVKIGYWREGRVLERIQARCEHTKNLKAVDYIPFYDSCVGGPKVREFGDRFLVVWIK